MASFNVLDILSLQGLESEEISKIILRLNGKLNLAFILADACDSLIKDVADTFNLPDKKSFIRDNNGYNINDTHLLKQMYTRMKETKQAISIARTKCMRGVSAMAGFENIEKSQDDADFIRDVVLMIYDRVNEPEDYTKIKELLLSMESQDVFPEVK